MWYILYRIVNIEEKVKKKVMGAKDKDVRQL
jgi:hypothetical protein